MNQLIKKDIAPSINKRAGYVRKIDVKSKINGVNNKKEIDFVANKIFSQLTKDLKTTINVSAPMTNNKFVARPKNVSNNKKEIDFVANKIFNQLTKDLKTTINVRVPNTIRKVGKPNNNVKMVNNPLFENASNNNVKMVNNPLFENASNNTFKLNNEITVTPNTTNNIRKSVNDIPEEVERQDDEVRNMVTKLNSERNRIKNKVTKELNLRPDNNGVFSERRGLDKGRIGQWAKKLREADTIEELKNIEQKMNQKTELRKNIENRYTKLGLTKVEKMDHRRKVVKFENNVDARRKLVEIQVKNKKTNNNNNNTKSVVSNYNSNANANSNESKKMKYGSRENFINAKKVELRELNKNTSTNFSRNINRMENRTNVAKLRGRIEGAVRRNESLKKVPPRNQKFIQTGISAQASVKANARRAELMARKAAKKKPPTKVEPVKVESVKVEPVKVEPVKVEPVMTNIERIKRAGAVSEARRAAKAELRKKNRQVAKSTGQGVKATQKKQQIKRK